MSKCVFFVNDICNHQGTHLQQSATDNNTNFNMIHNFNWPRKTQEHYNGGRGKKAMITLWDKSKMKLRKPLGQWIIDYLKKHNVLEMVPLIRPTHTLLLRK